MFALARDDSDFDGGRLSSRLEADQQKPAIALNLDIQEVPLARIVPLKSHAELSPDDPVFRLHELAEPLGPLTNAEMDAAIYGQ